MKYILGIDYFLFFLDFPHMGVPGAVALNTDGTVNIYINTLYSTEIQSKTVKHELRHLAREHFSCDWKTIQEKELEAEDLDDPTCTFAPDFSWVEYTQEPVEIVRTLPGPPPPYSAIRSAAMPEGVSFGFYVPDDSLQPHFQQGQLLWCDDQQLRPGDVGLFQYRGATICRQYHKDRFGMTYLFALDRKRSWDDIVVTSADERDLVCLGRVQTEKRIPLPGR